MQVDILTTKGLVIATRYTFFFVCCLTMSVQVFADDVYRQQQGAPANEDATGCSVCAQRHRSFLRESQGQSSPSGFFVHFADDTLTVNARDVRLKKLLEEIARQTGLTLVLRDSLEGDITIEFDRLSLEEGLRRILRQQSFAVEYSQRNQADEQSTPARPKELWILPKGLDESAALGANPWSATADLAFDPNTNTLFAVKPFGHQLIALDPATGVGTTIGDLEFDLIEALAFDPNSRTLFAKTIGATNLLIAIDPVTGVTTVVGALGFTSVQGLAFDPNTNTLFGTDTIRNQLITIDPTTGVATTVGVLGFPDVQGLAFDPNTNTLFGTDTIKNQLITIDTTTGLATAVGPLGFSGVHGLAFDPTTNTLFGTDVATNQLITINPNTGIGAAVR